MLFNGVNLMHHLNRCMLRLQKHMPEEKQLVSPDLLKQPKNLVEAIHQLFQDLSLIHISEPTRQEAISYAVFCLKKKK